MDAVLIDSACRSARSEDSGVFALRRALATEPGALRYQGTHILTYGAMRDLAEGFNAISPIPLRTACGGCDDELTAVMRGDAYFGGL